MHCPLCGAHDTKVVDSRLAADGDQVRRRRQCQDCKGRFTTFETVERVLPRVIKADNRREAFDEAKLRRGLMLALHKRPVSIEDMDAAVGRILRQLSACGEREIPSSQIGEWMMGQLRRLDQVAYVRFASIYHDFDDVQAFQEEIERLRLQIDPGKAQMSLLPDEPDA